MGFESIAHEAEGRMGYWLSGYSGSRNNCFSKIQLVGQKYRDKTTLASKTRFSRHCFGFQSRRFSLLGGYCWFSDDVTKIQTTKLSILLRFYFHGVLEQLKTNVQTNFPFKRVLGFAIKYAWISKLLRDAAFSWRPRELSFRFKKWLFSKNFAI